MPETKTLTATILESAKSLSGDSPPTIFRGQNFVLRGANSDSPYFEAYKGSKNLNENFDLTANAITGSIAYTSGSYEVTGTGTSFASELHIGQLILDTSGRLFCVKEIVSATSFIAQRPAPATGSGKTAYRLPQMFEVMGKRGVLLTGNAVEFSKGTLVAAGSGTLYINGSTLAGTSLVASNTPQVALFDPAAQTYSVQTLGFSSAPPKPTINVVAGGTKNMVVGNKYSFMFSYHSALPSGTGGWSAPCEVVKLDGSGNDIRITSTANQFEIDFTASLVGMPSNASGFVIWASLGGKAQTSTTGATVTLTSPNETNFQNGSWFEVAKIKTSDLVANKYTFDFLDTDAGIEVTKGDPPPTCEYIGKFDERPMFISCFGRGRSLSDTKGTNPGHYVLVSMFGNPDEAPSEWNASATRDIIGYFEGIGRWFLMTQNSLEFAFATGLLGATATADVSTATPIATRPYWKTGAYNRYSMCLVDDTIFGFSGGKIFQSIGNGDENVKKYDFGAKIEDITRKFNGGHVYVAYDSKNTQVLLIHTGAYQNASGYWVTEIYPFSLFANAWLPTILLSETDRDMIVSGVATVNERLEYLCGGRVFGGTYQTRTYRYDGFDEGDTITTTTMPAYLLWQLSDDGLEAQSKQIHSIRLTGRLTSPSVQIHGARPGGTVSITNMENGTSPIGTMSFSTSTEVTRYNKKPCKFKNLAMYTLRISSNGIASGVPDRLEEIAVEVSSHGRMR